MQVPRHGAEGTNPAFCNFGEHFSDGDWQMWWPFCCDGNDNTLSWYLAPVDHHGHLRKYAVSTGNWAYKSTLDLELDDGGESSRSDGDRHDRNPRRQTCLHTTIIDCSTLHRRFLVQHSSSEYQRERSINSSVRNQGSPVSSKNIHYGSRRLNLNT